MTRIWQPYCAPNTRFRLFLWSVFFISAAEPEYTAVKPVLTMAKICTISDSDSDTSSDQEDTKHSKDNREAEASLSGPRLRVSQTPRGEQMSRFRNLSINEDDFQEATDGRAGDGDSFRPRSRSAPPAFWAAKKYGRELRRMSDEFDTLLDKGMKRVKSAGAATQMRTSLSWFSSLWSHKESDTETLSAQNTRPAE